SSRRGSSRSRFSAPRSDIWRTPEPRHHHKGGARTPLSRHRKTREDEQDVGRTCIFRNGRTLASIEGGAAVVPEDEQHEKVAHQVRFLSDQGLTSNEMDGLSRQLWLLERLAGKDPTKLDPALRNRIQGDIARAAMDQLKATGLVDSWLEAWERRHEVAAIAE